MVVDLSDTGLDYEPLPKMKESEVFFNLTAAAVSINCAKDNLSAHKTENVCRAHSEARVELCGIF